jgi:uncharacterized membrane protein
VFFHPYGAVKAAAPRPGLLVGAEVDRSVAEILVRSCQSCHSDKTEWPWYSYVAPTSVMIESDVAKARSRMNLSHWDDYTIDEQQAMLIALGATVRSGEMPPANYTLIHPAAKLSREERERISQWVRTERRRLKLSTTAAPRVGG